MECKTAEERFNEKYITSTEIGEQLQVGRSTILQARARGLLPDAIVVRGVPAYLWERATLQPYLNAWKLMLDARRGKLA